MENTTITLTSTALHGIETGDYIKVGKATYVVTKKEGAVLHVVRHRPWLMPISAFVIGVAIGRLIFELFMRIQ